MKWCSTGVEGRACRRSDGRKSMRQTCYKRRRGKSFFKVGWKHDNDSESGYRKEHPEKILSSCVSFTGFQFLKSEVTIRTT